MLFVVYLILCWGLVSSAVPAGPGKLRAVDVHHHFFPTAQVPELTPLNDFGFSFNVTTVQDHLGFMDAIGVETAMLSPTIQLSFHTVLSPTAFLDLCQRALAAALDAVSFNPLRFGSLVMIPLPHIPESLEFLNSLENRTLQPDGFALSTAMGMRYLGDQTFDPVWAKLDAMEATVFVHPSETVDPPNLNFQPALMEFPFDTTRSIMSLVLNGTFTRFPHIRFIFTHNGGALPFLADRFHYQLLGTHGVLLANANATLRDLLHTRNIFFDTAQSAAFQWPVTLGLGFPPQHVLAGTDWPYTLADSFNSSVQAFDAPANSGCFDAAQMGGVEAQFALPLFPRVRREWVRAFGEAVVATEGAEAPSRMCPLRPMVF